MNEWEARELAGIEEELGADTRLAHVLAGPTRRERRWAFLRRRFYPAGFLLCALAYELASMSGAQTVTLLGAVAALLTAWIVAEVRALSPVDRAAG